MRTGVNLSNGIVSVNAYPVESLARAATWFPALLNGDSVSDEGGDVLTTRD
jgi:hypothetical protein